MVDLYDKYIRCNKSNYIEMYNYMCDNYTFINKNILLDSIKSVLYNNGVVVINHRDNMLFHYQVEYDKLNIQIIDATIILRNLKIDKIKELI